MVRPPETQSVLPRLIAASSFFVVAAFFAIAVVGFLSGGFRATPEFRSMALWPAYELLASAFAILLPFLQGVRRFVDKLGLPGKAKWVALAILWLPFLAIACVICIPVFGAWWFLLGFLSFALVHFVSYECEEVRHRLLGNRPHPLRRAVLRFAKCYGLAMLATAAALAVVFMPMDVMGVFLRSDPRLDFMSVAIGAFYFLFLGISEWIDLEGKMERATTRREEEQKRALEWTRRAMLGEEQRIDEHPSPPPGTGRFAPPEVLSGPGLAVDNLRLEGFEEWVEDFPLSAAARKKIQYWDRKLVRFGKPFRSVRRERLVSLVLAFVLFFASVVSLVVAVHPHSFKKKHERSAPMRAATHTEQSDRDAFKFLTVFSLVIGGIFGMCWWSQRRDQLGKSTATIDCYEGIVTGPDGATEKIRRCRLVVERSEAEREGPTRTVESFTLKAVASESGFALLLMEAPSRRDVETLRAELQPYGFDPASFDSEPGPESKETAKARSFAFEID